MSQRETILEQVFGAFQHTKAVGTPNAPSSNYRDPWLLMPATSNVCNEQSWGFRPKMYASWQQDSNDTRKQFPGFQITNPHISL